MSLPYNHTLLIVFSNLTCCNFISPCKFNHTCINLVSIILCIYRHVKNYRTTTIVLKWEKRYFCLPFSHYISLFNIRLLTDSICFFVKCMGCYIQMYAIIYALCVRVLNYRQTSNISRTLTANKIIDQSDVVGASPAGAAPTTSSFSV